MSNIPSTPADGNVLTLIVPAIAVLSAPTVAEMTATGKKDISCYLTPGGFEFGIDQATVDDPRECDTVTSQSPGRKTPSLSITGIDNTGNTTLEATSNDLALALVEGTTISIVRRFGMPFTTAVAAAHKVLTIKAIVGAKVRLAPEANSVLKSKWSLFVQDYRMDVAVGS